MQQEMKYIFSIYEEGSISKAAEKLYMTQSALSMAVQRVEHSIKALIFDRSKRPLELTPVGELYIQKYYEISQLEKELEEQIHDMNHLKSGSLTIGGTQYIFSYILAPILMQFKTQYPDVEIHLTECSSGQLEDKLINGSIDICMKCDEVTAPFTSHGHAFYDHLLLTMPRSFIQQYNLPPIALSAEEIKKSVLNASPSENLAPTYWERIPLLLLTSGNNMHNRILGLFEQHDIQPSVTLEVEQLVTAYHLAASGLGATFVPDTIVLKNNHDNLVYYKIASPLITRDFHFIMNKKGYITNAARIFMEMVRYNNLSEKKMKF